jgi:hypothetical protein
LNPTLQPDSAPQLSEAIAIPWPFPFRAAVDGVVKRVAATPINTTAQIAMIKIFLSFFVMCYYLTVEKFLKKNSTKITISSTLYITVKRNRYTK